MKKFLRFCLSLIILSAGVAISYLYATQIAPYKINVRNETFESTEIPLSLNGTKIVFIADLHINAFLEFEQYEKLVQQINNQHPDIVLFGGDLFDHPANSIPTDELIKQTTDLLKSIEAPLGKFAVLGNHDLESNSTRDMINQLLYDADFELLTNKSIRIRNATNQSIVLAGLDSEMLGYPDEELALENVQEQDFTLVICHTPDTVLTIPTNLVDLFLSGHGHGGQVYIPIIGAYYKANYAEQYYRDKHQIDKTLLDVSNGIGTTKMNIRFLADAEIVVYTLISK